MAPQLPVVAAILLLLLILVNGHLGTEGCIHCGHGFKNLKSRFAHLCAQYRKQYSWANCTKYPWGRESAGEFALDELSLDLLLEKTHRVFRVIEINQSLADLPKYWHWVHEVKMLQESRGALCPPACQGSATAVNCSTCLKMDVPCWDPKICYPGRSGLQKSILVLSAIAGSCLVLGLVACALEFQRRPGIVTEGERLEGGGEPHRDVLK